ncbi:MAG: DUF4834 family protein [Bacteroidota bacterium]
MTVLLKFFLILILVIYTFYKVAGFLFRTVFGNLRNDPGAWRQQTRSRPGSARNENLNIDKVPNENPKRNASYEGGEYIDFEEVK